MIHRGKELPAGLAAIALNPVVIDTRMLRSCLGLRAVTLIGCKPISETVSDFDAYTWFMGVSRARQLLAVLQVS